MDQHTIPDPSADAGRNETPPKNERSGRRFRIVKLEERIAPTTQSGGFNDDTGLMIVCTNTCSRAFSCNCH
jgi:hypothetical protein